MNDEIFKLDREGSKKNKTTERITTKTTVKTTSRPGEKTYSVNVLNSIQGITISGTGDYKENDTVTLTADGIKAEAET